MKPLTYLNSRLTTTLHSAYPGSCRVNYLDLPITLRVCDVLERWKSTKPSHRRFRNVADRSIEPHLLSIGVVRDETMVILGDVSAVIVVDYVITTGTQMNAAATVLSGLGVVPIGMPVFGFAWGRAVLEMVL